MVTVVLVGDGIMGQISQERTGGDNSKTKARIAATGKDGGFDFDFMSIQHLPSERRTSSLVKKPLKPPIKPPALLASPLY